MPIQAFKTNMV